MTEFHGHKVFYEKKARLKHLYIRIENGGDIIIKSSSLSIFRCRNLLKEKEQWLLRQLAKADETPRHDMGKNIRIFGELRKLADDSEGLSILKRIESSGQIDKERIRKHYFSFYKDRSTEYIPKRVEHFSARMKLYPSEIRFRRMRRRWGSCNCNGVITFNTLLTQLSKEQIDYVVVHELAHLKHMNHSSEFHALVEKSLPGAGSIHLSMKQERILY